MGLSSSRLGSRFRFDLNSLFLLSFHNSAAQLQLVCYFTTRSLFSLNLSVVLGDFLVATRAHLNILSSPLNPATQFGVLLYNFVLWWWQLCCCFSIVRKNNVNKRWKISIFPSRFSSRFLYRIFIYNFTENKTAHQPARAIFHTHTHKSLF